MFCYFKILAEHEWEELQSTSGENSEQLTINAEEPLPAVVEVATQTQNTGKSFEAAALLKASLDSLLRDA